MNCIILLNKFPSFYTENAKNDKWKSLINGVLQTKLGKLNRYFKQLKLNFNREDSQKISKYTITKDDEFLISDLDEYVKNPQLFFELDNQLFNEDEDN